MCFSERLWGRSGDPMGLGLCCVVVSCNVVASVGFGDIAKRQRARQRSKTTAAPAGARSIISASNRMLVGRSGGVSGISRRAIGPLGVPRTHSSVPDHHASCDLSQNPVQSRSQPTVFEGPPPASRYPLLDRYQATLSIGSDRTPETFKDETTERTSSCGRSSRLMCWYRIYPFFCHCT